MMERMENELKMGYGKSYEAQGRHVVINGVAYFNQISYNMDLCNNNYHLMANLLIKLTHGCNNLQVEVPEWQPTIKEIGDYGKNMEDINGGKDTDMNDAWYPKEKQLKEKSRERKDNTEIYIDYDMREKINCDEWIKPRKVITVKYKSNRSFDHKINTNRHNTLSDCNISSDYDKKEDETIDYSEDEINKKLRT